MHKRERHFAMLNDNRVVQPFEWGTEFVAEHVNGNDPRALLLEHSRHVVEISDEYFAAPEGLEFSLETRLYPSSASLNANPPKKTPVQTEVKVLTWQSAVETPSAENNTAYATYFPHENKRAAVIVLPHWNAKAGTYFDLGKFFNKVGLSALRLTLPYHEERMPPELERADHLVAPNVGRSLQSIRQAVADTRGRFVAENARLRKDRHRWHKYRFMRRVHGICPRSADRSRRFQSCLGLHGRCRLARPFNLSRPQKLWR